MVQPSLLVPSDSCRSCLSLLSLLLSRGWFQILLQKGRCVRSPSWIAVMSHIPLQRPLGSWNAAWITVELHVCRAWMPNSASVLKQFYYIWRLCSHNFCCTWKNETTDPFMSTPVDKMPDIKDLVGHSHYLAKVLQWMLGNWLAFEKTLIKSQRTVEKNSSIYLKRLHVLSIGYFSMCGLNRFIYDKLDSLLGSHSYCKFQILE